MRYFSCFSLRTGLLFALLASAVFVSGSIPASAGQEDHVNDGIRVADAWLAQIDAAQYDLSYQQGAATLHQNVPEGKWILILKTVRPQYGPLISRKQVSHVYRPDGFQGFDGECIVLAYDSEFKRISPAAEIVIIKWEDGRWRPASYFLGVKTNPAGGDDAPQQMQIPATEINSQTIKNPNNH
jgi:hypothetical protein